TLGNKHPLAPGGTRPPEGCRPGHEPRASARAVHNPPAFNDASGAQQNRPAISRSTARVFLIHGNSHRRDADAPRVLAFRLFAPARRRCSPNFDVLTFWLFGFSTYVALVTRAGADVILGATRGMGG